MLLFIDAVWVQQKQTQISNKIIQQLIPIEFLPASRADQNLPEQIGTLQFHKICILVQFPVQTQVNSNIVNVLTKNEYPKKYEERTCCFDSLIWFSSWEFWYLGIDLPLYCC